MNEGGVIDINGGGKKDVEREIEVGLGVGLTVEVELPDRLPEVSLEEL